MIIIAALSFIALATPSLTLAADQTPPQSAPVESPSVQAIPVKPADDAVVKQPAITNQPINDNLVDYRYCLELKTNREIAECRYKKK